MHRQVNHVFRRLPYMVWGTFTSRLIVRCFFKEAAALGYILIILGAACLFIINHMADSKMGGVFG